MTTGAPHDARTTKVATTAPLCHAAGASSGRTDVHATMELTTPNASGVEQTYLTMTYAHAQIREPHLTYTASFHHTPMN